MTPQQNTTPKICFEDNHLMIVEKPAGWLSQGDGSKDPNLVDWARVHVARKYIGLIHRLDRNVSGLMVLGKRSKASERLSEAMRVGKICRSYLALVEGQPPDQIQARHWLVKNEKNNLVTVYPQPHPAGKVALLSAQRASVAVRPNYALLEVTLETGRSHQIRAQLSFLGFPIVGDSKYGARTDFGQRLALHSAKLSLPHPMSGETLHFSSDLPEDFRKFLLSKS